MVTFFTTVKDFQGKNIVNQINAIRSWLIGNKYKCEVIIFNHRVDLKSLGNLPNIIFDNTISTSETGIPFINAMFYRASILAKNNVLCFLNADIIINDIFIKNIIQIDKRVKRDYLIVGERLDTQLDYFIDFSDPLWYDKLIKTNNLHIHPPLGSDFFVFPKGQYSPDKFSLPDLLVGRPGWDNYMIYISRKKSLKLINLAPSTRVIHQNHDYNHKNKSEVIKKKEDIYNYNYLPPTEKYKYILIFCNYKFENNRIKKTYHDNDFSTYYHHECLWKKVTFFSKIILKLEIFFISKFSIK